MENYAEFAKYIDYLNYPITALVVIFLLNLGFYLIALCHSTYRSFIDVWNGVGGGKDLSRWLKGGVAPKDLFEKMVDDVNLVEAALDDMVAARDLDIAQLEAIFRLKAYFWHYNNFILRTQDEVFWKIFNFKSDRNNIYKFINGAHNGMGEDSRIQLILNKSSNQMGEIDKEFYELFKEVSELFMQKIGNRTVSDGSAVHLIYRTFLSDRSEYKYPTLVGGGVRVIGPVPSFFGCSSFDYLIMLKTEVMFFENTELQQMKRRIAKYIKYISPIYLSLMFPVIIGAGSDALMVLIPLLAMILSFILYKSFVIDILIRPHRDGLLAHTLRLSRFESMISLITLLSLFIPLIYSGDNISGSFLSFVAGSSILVATFIKVKAVECLEIYRHYVSIGQYDNCSLCAGISHRVL